jgi:hypothetical protein
MSEFVARLRLEATAQQLVSEVGRGTASLQQMTQATGVLAASQASLSGRVDALTSAQQREVAATQAATATNERAASALQQMAAAVNATEEAERKRLTALQAYTQANTQATKAYADFASVYDAHHLDFVTQYQAAARAAAGFADEQRKGAGAGKLQQEQLKQLGFQLNDIITGLASGQQPMRIFAQQGGQVFQALQMGAGGAAGSVRTLMGFLTPLRLLFGAW